MLWVPSSTWRPASAIVEMASYTAVPTSNQIAVQPTMTTSLNSWANNRPGVVA